MQKLASHLLATTALVPMLLLPVAANPLDPHVVAGSATVAGEGTSLVVIDQSTDKAIIDWRSFNIGGDESTHFIQPHSQSVVLNRVTGGEGASQILGALKSNGQVFLINPDGILFGKDATIDVGALVATTHGIRNADFMAGNYRFDQAGRAEASIVNLGTITVQDQGFAALVGPGVRNSGIIRANLGKIGLASADGFTLDFYGDELIKLAINDTTAGTVVDLETGQTLHDLVSNSGLLSANGGTVQLTASAARAVVNSVIDNTGNIEADTVGMQNGKIILGAATAATKPAGAPIQSVKVSGNLSVAGDEQGEVGGAVQITGELIELTVATIDAFGWKGGGKVLIGGDYMGGNGDPGTIDQYGIELESYTIPTASYVFADDRTLISASALENGNGGKIILWSDIATVTAADLAAQGGTQFGDGGFIETSGKYLAALVAADASARNGVAGTWLLDPLDVHIKDAPDSNFTIILNAAYSGITGNSAFPTGNPSVISVSNVELGLNSGTNVRVTTRGTVGGQPGDIYIEDDIAKSAGGDVFAIIDSARNVYFTSGVRLVSTSGKVSFLVYAKDGKVVAKNIHVDVNGGQFLIESSEVSPGVLKFTTPTSSPAPLLSGIGTTARATRKEGPFEGPTLWSRDRAFDLLSQTDPSNAGLYISEEWARVEYKGVPRWKEACLAVVYAMIEHARGNTDYRIGQPGTWTDVTGAGAIEGTGPGYKVARSVPLIQAELLDGNPVILRGESDELGPQHFILAVGIDASGRIIAFDPYGGEQVKIDPVSWRIIAGGAGTNYQVIDMRTVDM